MSKIYTGDYTVIKNEIEYLLDMIYKSNDKYDSLNLYSSCELLIYEYWCHNPDGIDYYRKLNRFKSFIATQRNKINQLNSNSYNDFISKRDSYLDFSESFLNGVAEIDYIDLDYNLQRKIKFSQEDEYSIFLDFLMQYYSNYIELFSHLIKTKRIFYSQSLDEEDKSDLYDTSGISIFNSYNKDYYIFIKENLSSTSELSALAHEFGHIVDYENLLETNSKKDYSYYTFRSPFIETISSMFELDFCDFCLHNHFETKYINKILQDFYLNTIYHFNELNLLCRLENSILKSDKYRNVSKEKLYSIAKNSCELAVDYDDFCDPCELNHNYNIEYGYGRFLAIFFSYLRKNDSSRFSDSFKKFLILRNNYFPTDLCEQLGTTKEEMTKIFKDEINSKDVKIYIK